MHIRSRGHTAGIIASNLYYWPKVRCVSTAVQRSSGLNGRKGWSQHPGIPFAGGPPHFHFGITVKSRNNNNNNHILLLLLLLPLTLQSNVGFVLSSNVLPFFPICHQLSPSSHSQHSKISFYFLFPFFPGSSPSSRPFQLSEDLFGHPILLQSL